jgi:hypothetical protein
MYLCESDIDPGRRIVLVNNIKSTIVITDEDGSDREEEALISYSITPELYFNEFGHEKERLFTSVVAQHHKLVHPSNYSGNYLLAYTGGIFNRGRKNLFDDCLLLQIFDSGVGPP